MKGIEISENFFLQSGKEIFEKQFGDIYGAITVGLVGEGSECFGFDDNISLDHDFEPGFCVFVDQNIYEKYGFALERAYSGLPKEFSGLKRQSLAPADGARHGVIVTEKFYQRFTGVSDAPIDYKTFLYAPSFSLSCACNGRIFKEGSGKFMQLRKILEKGYPEDVRKKKLAAHAAMMAQSGQYNYSRLIARGETGAAQLAVFEFVKSVISTVYLLNNKYEPFYKWAYRGMRDLPILGNLEPALSNITELGNSAKQANEKKEIIDDIAILLCAEYARQRLSDANNNDLSSNAFSITDKIKDNNLRNMHIMEGI